MASKDLQGGQTAQPQNTTADNVQQQQPRTTTGQPSSTSPYLTLNIINAFKAGTSDHYYTTSVAMTLICALAGTWCVLPCTIAAIFIAKKAEKQAAEGDTTGAEKNARVAYWLNIVSIIIGIVSYIITIVVIIIAAVIVAS